jgi:UDP-N-acetylmuramoyl-tripeptide--D-alanyl-D-alanine ligase
MNPERANMTLSIADLHRIVGGRLRLGAMPPRDGEFSAIGPIVTDSRAIRCGDLFWGLAGATHDGSHFAEDALSRGACGVVTSGRWVAPWAGRWSLEVEDTAAALCRLAAWNCDRFSGRLLTIEGALGKSITAAMAAAVLNVRLVGETIAAESDVGSQNNIALELAGLPVHHDYAIVELHAVLAAQGFPIGRLSNPDLAVFVHSGASRAAPSLSAAADPLVLKRLRLAVKSGYPLVVNGDDIPMHRVAQDAANVLFLGRGADAHIVADRVESGRGRLRFSVAGRRYSVAASGRHQLTAALAAIAIGRRCGLSDAEIADGLASFEPVHRACQISQAGEVTIIDDTGTSRAAATIAAMDLLAELGTQGRKFVLYGDTATENVDSNLLSALGERAVTRAAADLLVASGRSAKTIIECAQHAGLSRASSVVCDCPEDAGREVLSRLRPGDTVLVSGRSMAAIKQNIQQQTALLRAA